MQSFFCVRAFLLILDLQVFKKGVEGVREEILSVGIDIGTSTTQLIFSTLIIENLASNYTIPRISIVAKTVTYCSEIYFTPLKSSAEIDVGAVKKIVQQEYRKAGMRPEQIRTGAVIITGEMAKKQNAGQVLSALSSMAGDFVVATAGPDLESVLSAKGAGADKCSENERTVIANLDVGGGTTNIAVYQKGKLRGTSCLDIGGRLIRIENNKISYIAPKIKTLTKARGISIETGDAADFGKLRRICTIMADQLAQAICLSLKDEVHSSLYTNKGKALSSDPPIKGITFSGGVADYVYHTVSTDFFRYGDIGILLGEAIRSHAAFDAVKRYDVAETIRATVVGAGIHTTEISGSTITCAMHCLPIKNIPVLRIQEDDEESAVGLAESIRKQIPLYAADGKVEQVAIAFSGAVRTSFSGIQETMEAIISGAQEVIESQYPLIIIVENDIAKALGNAINARLEHRKEVICIDGIRAKSGDYADIGEPVGGGRAVPVVIKTLVFNT